MAQITIKIPDAVTDRVIDGFCKRYHYTDVSADETQNKAGKVKFVKAQIIEYVKRAVRDAETEAAAKVATDAASESADADIVLT